MIMSQNFYQNIGFLSLIQIALSIFSASKHDYSKDHLSGNIKIDKDLATTDVTRKSQNLHLL